MNLDGFLDSLAADYTPSGDYLTNPTRYEAVLRKLHAMTTPSVMHLLNSACRRLEPGEIYLEIGVYRGSTLIGALLDNDAHALAVDDRSNDSRDGLDNTAEFWRNVKAWGVADRVAGVVRQAAHFSLAAGDDRGVMFPMETPPDGQLTHVMGPLAGAHAGVLMLDGNHADADDTYHSLQLCRRVLARRALIVMDDANMPKIHEAAHRFVAEEPRATLLLDRRTPGHMHPSWWNGTIAIGWDADAG